MEREIAAQNDDKVKGWSIVRALTAFIAFATPLFLVSGLLSVPARILLYRASPWYDHFHPEAFPVPWWEIVARHGLFHFLLCSAAAVIVAVYAGRGRARFGTLLSTTVVVGALAGALAVAVWISCSLIASVMIQWLYPVCVFLASAAIALVVCHRIRKRERLAGTLGWFN